ncbi:MAG: HAD family hydrolase [Acidimicrobiales bacterium]
MALERMRRIDTVLFDKTGTLTRANPRSVDLAAVEGVDPQRVLALAAAVETDSEHPRPGRGRRRRSNGVVPAATGFEALAGRGVAGDADGHRVAVGRPALLRELGLGRTGCGPPPTPGGRAASRCCTSSSTGTSPPR